MSSTMLLLGVLHLFSGAFAITDKLKIQSLNMNPSESFTHVNTENHKDTTNGMIQGCVMINRYDESPTTLVVTCRGDSDNVKKSNAEAGIIFYDVTDDANPKYMQHWKAEVTSVEGQDSIDDILVVVDFQGKLWTFENWSSTIKEGTPLKKTGVVQTSSNSLLHVKAFAWNDRKYAFISTGFSYHWNDNLSSKMCDVTTDEDYYNCGVDSQILALGTKGVPPEKIKVGQHKERGFDGIIVVDITDPANPVEISQLCLKVKCPEGTSVFFGLDGKPYGTVGGINSEHMAVIDLSDPHAPETVTEVHKSHLNQLVPLYGIHPALGPNGLYEAYANWGMLQGGLTVWNFTTPSHPQEAAYLDSKECQNSNRAIFWNDRYLLTPLESVAYGGVCVFDICEVNKPVFRAFMHLEEFGFDPMARTTYGMNAYKDHAYFVVYNLNQLETYKINLDRIHNHVTDANDGMHLFEKKSVFLNGFNASTCNVGETYNEVARLLNAMEIYALIVGGSVTVLCAICALVLYCCCKDDDEEMDKIWANKQNPHNQAV